MRRPLAVLVLFSLWSLQSQALAFHVHAVADDEHDNDHRHGPAIHHHDEFDANPHIRQNDSSGDVITLVVPVAAASTPIVLFAELTEVVHAPELFVVGEARAIDARSHGPPSSHDSFLRGPPSSILL